MQNQEPSAENKTSGSADRKPETISQLAKRHMMDQNHTTTDEELKQAVLELDNPIVDDSVIPGNNS